MSNVAESMSEKRASVIDEARARTIWGERASEILGWMLDADHTLEREEAIRLLKRLRHERDLSMRRNGARDLSLAAILILGSVFACGQLFGYLDEGGSNPISVLVIFACIGIVVLGVYFLRRGVERVVLGAAADGLDTDELFPD